MADQPFRISLSDGRSFPGRADRTLLRQLQEAGCNLPVACRNGHCGLCYARLLGGATTPTVSRQTVPLCISYAAGDIKLHLPEARGWQRFACTLVSEESGSITLRLPAGRTELRGDQWLLAAGEQVARAQFVHREKRLVCMRPDGVFSTDSSAIIQLFNIAASVDGRYQLRDGPHVLLGRLSARVARELQQSLLQSALSVTR